MASNMNRRKFLKASVAVSAGAGVAFGFEEKSLLAQSKRKKKGVAAAANNLPKGKIGDLEISRVICGGNLISGFAHSRDLIYVSPLLRHYFTDEKVFETLQKCEEHGVNTAILRLDNNCLRIVNKYWNEIGGNIQWIAQCKMPKNDWKSDIQRAIDNGADAVYLHGGVADGLVKANKIDEIGKAIDYMKTNGVPAGIAGHMVDVPKAVVSAGIDPDFFMKTLNAKNYWSAGPMPRKDSVWAESPEETIGFMKDVKKPWIAYKVLGAGAIHPRDGFQYAFAKGADFICVGMFDFQVQEDITIAKNILAGNLNRERAWMG